MAVNLLLCSCKNDKKEYAVIYERKSINADSTLIKFYYKKNRETRQDSLMIISSTVIPDSFLMSTQK